MRDLEGTRILITGANAGIGLETARSLAARGAELVAACRSQERAEHAIRILKEDTGNDNISFLSLDLASFASVRAAAATVLAGDKPLHLLLNNAGLAGKRGKTQDGYEMAFAVNHLGHFLLSALLFPRLKESAPARIVHVASKAHYDAKALDLEAVQQSTRTFIAVQEYSVSKLANVLFASELALRATGTGVTSYSLHPGVVASDIWRQIPWPIRPLMKRRMISNEEGAITSLHCATAPAELLENGAYYDLCKPKTPSALAQDPTLAAALWERSEAFTGQRFDPTA